MKFIRKNGRIIPIGDKEVGVHKPNLSGSPRPKVEATEKITLSLKNRLLRKINGLKNKFHGTDPRKIKSAHNVAQGKHAANLIGKTVTFGDTKKVFTSQSVKSGKNLSKITNLLNKSNNIQATKGGIALAGIAAGAYYFLKKKEPSNE